MLALSIAMVLILTMPAVASAAPGCSAAEMRTGICSRVSSGGDALDVGASDTKRASPPGVDSSGGGATDTDPGGVAPGTSSPSTDGSGLGGNPRRIVDDLDPCPECESDAAPSTTPLTLRDLVSFSPTVPSIRMEPDGWMLRGLPANFIADTSQQTVNGTLLGRPIDVRFAPSSFTWTWGDGQTDTVDEAGRTWEDLGLERFSKTATSHTYAERGTVTVSLRVSYGVSYRFDGGAWQTVEGTVAASAALDAYVGSAQTVLVPDDCRSAPGADGC